MIPQWTPVSISVLDLMQIFQFCLKARWKSSEVWSMLSMRLTRSGHIDGCFQIRHLLIEWCECCVDSVNQVRKVN